MSDQEEEEIAPEVRLWSIPKREQTGNNLYPMILVAVLTAIGIGLAAIPCLSLRLQILSYAEDTGPLSFWQMSCEKQGGQCVCVQGGSEITGGEECNIAEDLKLRCRSQPADYLPPAPPN